MCRFTLKHVVCLLALILTSVMPLRAFATPLDDYVSAPDSAFSWQLLATYPHSGYTDFVFHMSSQNWLTSSEVDRTLWEHHMVITVPDTVSHETGLLYITGGSTSSGVPSANDPMLVQMAVETNTVTAMLRQVPNQPLTFLNDPASEPRTEDEQIAYCWRMFLETGESKWLSRLPMTKSAVRALDTVTQFMATPDGGQRTVNQFVVTGASKRGWTTWTTAAVDSRVVAFAPMVIDLLNMQVSFRHHFDALGFWSPQIVDYENEGITEQFNTPEMAALCEIVEPYSYLDRYVNKPKLLLNGSQDEFFLPDSSQFYWERLTGEKRLRYVPNAGHGLNAGAVNDLRAWYWSIINGVPRPDVTWTKKYDGSLEIHVSGGTPSQVLLWQTSTVSERSFSLEFQPPLYSSTVLAPVDTDTYIASVPAPPSGWKAFLVEFTFPSGGPTPFRFTTEISIVPDVLPYGPQYALGAESELLDAAFYAGEASDGSNVSGRMAFVASPSNAGTRAAFWAVNAATQNSAFFVVDFGDPSSWRRITIDYPTSPNARACWVPDDSAILVGPYRIPIPPPGQVSSLETIVNHGYSYNDTSSTLLPENNWVIGLSRLGGLPKDIVALPVLADGSEDPLRSPVVLTDFTGDGMSADWPAVSPDGTLVAFADYHGVGSLGVSGDLGDVYILKDVDEIIAAPKRPGTNISTLAPTSRNDVRLVSIRSLESDNFAHTPVFSQDKSIVLFSEDWNNLFTDSAYLQSMQIADFDVMIANADGFEADQRLQQAGNQMMPVPTRGGTRILYLRDIGGVSHVMATTLEVSRAVGGTQLGNNDVLVTEQQTAADGSGTSVLLAEGTTVNFPNGEPQAIQIETPVNIVNPDQLPDAVDAIPVVRDFGPDGTTFNPALAVTVSYTDAEVQGLDEAHLKIFKFNTVTSKFDIEITDIISRDTDKNTITFALTSFSTYGLGGETDTDQDGTIDDSDPDDDNDGVLDVNDSYPLDTDNDGIDNALDPDDDSDGTPDLDDAFPYDTDNDSLNNAVDLDDDGDGVADLQEAESGTDPLDVNSFPLPLDTVKTLGVLGAVFAVLMGLVISRSRRASNKAQANS